MTSWIRTAACAAILLLQGCVPAEIAVITSPTLVVGWRAVGTVHGEPFDATGEIACIPVLMGTTFKQLAHEAFPRWTRIPLSAKSVLVLNVSTMCYLDSFTQESILVNGYVFENAAHPRWVRPVHASDWQVRLEPTEQRAATTSDRQKIIREARRLLQSMDVFCVACDPSSPDPFTRIVRRDLSATALPHEFFERWGDTSAGSCRRSRPIPVPGGIEHAGVDERHLSACTRLRRDDPFERHVWPPDARCDAFDARLSTLAPAHTSDDRIWRRSEFADPLDVDGCPVALDEAIASFRDGPDAGDVRLYQSSTSTFTLYAGEGVGILLLYERNPADLRRAELELPR